MYQCGLKILRAVSEEGKNLVQNFVMRLGTFQK